MKFFVGLGAALVVCAQLGIFIACVKALSSNEKENNYVT